MGIKVFRMIEDDARLFARALYRQRRHMAYDYALERAVHLLGSGDEEGYRIWRMVARCVIELEQKKQPPELPQAIAS